MTFKIVTYSPSDVELTFGGYTVGGWNNISINRTQTGFITVEGIRGKNTRVRSKNTSAVITITCLQTSDANSILSQIHAIDLETGMARIELVLKDNSGESTFSSNEAYVQGYPEAVFSGDFEMREWTIYCHSTENTYFVGGNTRPVTNIFDTAVEKVTNFVNNIF